MTKAVYFIQYLFYRLCVAAINAIPFNPALRIANFLGRFILKFNRRRMAITRSNLQKAFAGKKTDAEIEAIVHAVNGRLFEIAVEFARIPKLVEDPERWIPRVTPGYIWDALKKGQGAILLVSHLGNWEVLANGGGAEGYPIHALGKTSPNPYINSYIQKLRGKTGLKTVEKIGSVKDVTQLLKENQVVCLALDQRVKGGDPVQFLGQTAYFSSLPVLAALRYGTPVIPCFVFKKENPRQYLITATPPLELKEGESFKETLSLNMKFFAERIEEEILKDPAEWVLWRHNIWKD